MTRHDRHPNYILAAYMASGTWPARASSGSSPGDARHCVLTELRREFLQFRGRAGVFGFTVAGHGWTGGAGC